MNAEGGHKARAYMDMLDILTHERAVCGPALVVVWRINEVCNLACGFCGYSRAVARTRLSAREEQVRALGAVLAGSRAEPEFGVGALGRYGRAQGRGVMVSWLGGEPFLWR